MSGLKYNDPSGGIKAMAEEFYYSQSVDLGNGTIKCSGQGGWTIEGGPLADFPLDAREQIDNAFANITHVLQAAGLSGADDVYLVRSYHTNIEETMGLVTEAMKKHIPSHRPLWTAVGVTKLGDPKMKIEIEVEARKAL